MRLAMALAIAFGTTFAMVGCGGSEQDTTPMVAPKTMPADTKPPRVAK